MAVARIQHFGERAFKFMRKQPPRESEARQRLLRDLYVSSPVKLFEHGFPHKPTAIAYDPKLSLLALGTEAGSIIIYAREGIEFCGQQNAGNSAVMQLHFLPGQGRIASVHSDNSIHLWEIDTRKPKLTFKIIRSFHMPNGQVKNISVCCLSADFQRFYIGTEACAVQVLDLKNFQLSGRSLPVEQVMQSAPDDFRKASPGAVEALLESPTEPDRVLVGFSRGLLVLWNTADGQVERVWNAGQQQELESACWLRSGQQFVSCHSDGSYILWRLDSESPTCQPVIPYGPFPCKAISRIDVRSLQDDQMIVYAGGMPRSSFGDRHTVSVLVGKRQVAFDFGSRVLDFIVLCAADEKCAVKSLPSSPEPKTNGNDSFSRSPVPNDIGNSSSPLANSVVLNDSGGSSPASAAPVYDCPHTIIVLCEEEIVAIDLESEGWPQFKLPYFISIHASPVTCTHHVSGISEVFLKRLYDAGDTQNSMCSTRKWPITGGKFVKTAAATRNKREMLLTGHENGSVCFWDLGDSTATQMQLVYVLHTATLYGMSVGGLVPTNLDSSAISNEDIDDWPPFRKAGVFDPFSDDPRLAVQRISLCPATETLAVAGMAGQVIVLAMRDRPTEIQPPHPIVSKIVPDKVASADGSPNINFVWRGHDALPITDEKLKFSCGFQIAAVMQLHPPAPISAIALNTDWGVVAAGTPHGLAIFDYIQKKEIGSKCILEHGGDSDVAQGNLLSRAKTLKKSLRSSIRRLRQGRSERFQHQKAPGNRPTGRGPSAVDRMPSPAVIKNEERQIESRQLLANTDDTHLGSLVRCLSFADTYLVTPNVHQPSLLAGTNAGSLLAFSLSIPPPDRRYSEAISFRLSKELHLKHGAPVMHAEVLDRHGTPFSSICQQRAGMRPVDFVGGHMLLVASEEQIKVFTLPGLKPYGKVKVTAKDGSKLRRVGVVDYISRSDSNVHEYAATYVTNLGEIATISLPSMHKHLTSMAIPRENVNAILSTTFTNQGHCWFLATPSQFACYALAARLYVEQAIDFDFPVKRLPILAERNSPEKRSPSRQNGNNHSVLNTSRQSPVKSPQGSTSKHQLLETSPARTGSSQGIAESPLRPSLQSTV